MRVLAFALAISAGAAAAAEPFELRGLVVDRPVDCEKVAELSNRAAIPTSMCQKGLSTMFTTDFFDGQAEFTLYIDGGQLVSVLVTAGQPNNGLRYAPVAKALSDKFGKPARQQSTVTLRNGNKLAQEVLTWKRGGTTMILSRHATGVDQPALSLTGRLNDAQTKDAESKAGKTL